MWLKNNMVHEFVVDRIEGGVAVLLGEQISVEFAMPLAVLPQGVHEGQILAISIDEMEDYEEMKQQRSRELMSELLRGEENQD